MSKLSPSKSHKFTAQDGDVTVSGTVHPRQAGVAGNYAYAVTITYTGPDWTATATNTLHGSTYGGPIVAESAAGHQTFVSSAVMDRCGSILTPDWAIAFYRGTVWAIL